MADARAMARKRALVSTTRFRFSPHLQPIKESALDDIVVNILAIFGTGNGMDLPAIREAFSVNGRDSGLNVPDTQACLDRLLEHGKIECTDDRKRMRYRLTAATKKDAEEVRSATDRQLKGILRQLFSNDPQGFERYEDAFLHVLSIIFAQAGEEIALTITGEEDLTKILSPGTIPDTVASLRSQYPSLDHSLLQSAVIDFFRHRHPAFDDLKWNMSQSFYLTKMLGMDPNGRVLSEDLFSEATFFLDTNVLIPALEPADAYHASFAAVVSCSKALGIEFRVCPSNIEELENWVDFQRSVAIRALNRIPEALAPKVNSPILRKYYAEVAAGQHPDIEDLFESFGEPQQKLAERYGATVDQDLWFETARSETGVQELARTLQQRATDRRGEPKRLNAAMYDATSLAWVARLRRETTKKAWLITTDRSLPGAVVGGSDSRSLAITMDALIQWISPLAQSPTTKQGFIEGFAQIMRDRLLPRDQILKLEDFLMFQDMEQSTADMPPDDVEGAIRYVRAHAPSLDPNDPRDLQKMQLEVSRFLASPGRTYKMNVAQLELEQKQNRIQYEERLRVEQGKTATAQAELEATTKASDETIRSLQSSQEALQKQLEQDRLAASARSRLTLTGLLLIASLGVLLLLTNHFGSGDNLFQKVLGALPLFGAVVGMVMVVGWFCIGRDRLEAIGGPFPRLFRME